MEDNLELLSEIGERRLGVLREGYQFGKIAVKKADPSGIEFKVEFRNGTDGHNVPTGFDAERVVWIFVTVTDSQGRVVFQSGDLDPNGDVRDSHSIYVHDGKLPLDKYLFSLQSRFIVRMVRGGEREQVLALNYSPDPLPFLRRETVPMRLPPYSLRKGFCIDLFQIDRSIQKMVVLSQRTRSGPPFWRGRAYFGSKGLRKNNLVELALRFLRRP